MCWGPLGSVKEAKGHCRGVVADGEDPPAKPIGQTQHGVLIGLQIVPNPMTMLDSGIGSCRPGVAGLPRLGEQPWFSSLL